jgi:hypothetical protein
MKPREIDIMMFYKEMVSIFTGAGHPLVGDSHGELHNDAPVGFANLGDEIEEDDTNLHRTGPHL